MCYKEMSEIGIHILYCMSSSCGPFPREAKAVPWSEKQKRKDLQNKIPEHVEMKITTQ